jgi:dihydroneopterin aldolase
MIEPDRIVIEGLEFYAYHGTTNEEQQIGHRYVIDLVLEVSTRAAGLSDRLEDTVSYSDVAQAVMKLGTESRFRLMEALAEQIAVMVLEQYPVVQAVRVHVSKRLPPAGMVLERAGVEIVRRRD